MSEQETPNHILAERVWAGSQWHYPHLEKMKAEIAALRAERDEARKSLSEVESRQIAAESELANANQDFAKAVVREQFEKLAKERAESDRAVLAKELQAYRDHPKAKTYAEGQMILNELRSLTTATDKSGALERGLGK